MKNLMKDFFRYKFNRPSYIILFFMMLITVPVAIYDILKVANIGRFYSYYPIIDIVTVGAMLILLVLVLTIFIASGYKFKDKHILLNCIFIRRKIEYADILMFCMHPQSRLVAMYFNDKKSGGEVRFIVVCIKDENKDFFMEKVRRLNPQVTVSTTLDEQ